MRFLELARAVEALRPELDRAYAEVLDSGSLILGQQVGRFEREFAAYCGTGHCVGVGNGQGALELALRAMEIGTGDEVIVPSNTFIATWLAVSGAGANPVPVDPDPASHNIDPDLVEAAITPRTRAIIAVHLYGQPAPMARLAEIARANGLRLIEDAAHAHGAALDGVRAGALGDAAAFSFYPTKNLPALGDGGAVTTDDSEVAEQIRILRHYGASARDVHDRLGLNSRLDELQAAFLRRGLTHLNGWNDRRREIATRYADALADTGLVMQEPEAGSEPVYHLFVLRTTRRTQLRDHLEDRGIATLVHYPTAPHLQSAYAHLTIPRESLPVAERLQDEVVSLPLYPYLEDREVDQVIDGLLSFR